MISKVEQKKSPKEKLDWNDDVDFRDILIAISRSPDRLAAVERAAKRFHGGKSSREASSFFGRDNEETSGEGEKEIERHCMDD